VYNPIFKIKRKMKKILHALLGFSFIITMACEKPLEEPKISDGYQASTNLIQLENLQIGQKSTYIRAASCQHYVVSDTTFKLLKDTLVLEIIRSDADGYLVKETINQISPICGTGTVGFSTPFFFHLKKTGDSLTARTQLGSDSRLSQIYANRTIPLRPTTTNAKTVNKWLLPDLSSDTYWGYIESVTRDNVNLGKANIWWDGSTTLFDGPFRGLVYNNQAGIIAVIGLGSQLPRGTIWYLKP
jgi:hypothetical protein